MLCFSVRTQKLNKADFYEVPWTPYNNRSKINNINSVNSRIEQLRTPPGLKLFGNVQDNWRWRFLTSTVDLQAMGANKKMITYQLLTIAGMKCLMFLIDFIQLRRSTQP